MTTIPYRWMNSTVTMTNYYLSYLADSSAQLSVKLDLSTQTLNCCMWC